MGGSRKLHCTGVDGIALIARQIGSLRMYTLAPCAPQRIGRLSDSDKEWQDGATGQFHLVREELAVGRETINPLASLLVMHYVTGETWEATSPSTTIRRRHRVYGRHRR